MKKGVISVVIISVVICLLYFIGTLKTFDNFFFDNYQKNIDTGNPVEKFIVVVAIDDLSLKKFDVWPVARSKYAELVKILNKGGAKVIAFDVNFDSYSGYAYEDDLDFSKQLAKSKNVILARDYYMERNLPVLRDPIKELKDNAVLAMVNPVLDRDSFIRRYTMLAYHRDEALLYFALQASMLYKNINNRELRLNGSKLLLADIAVPLDHNGRMLINYFSGDKGISVVPFSHVLERGFLELNPDYFRNKLVLVGSTASYLQDSFPTPVDINMPGVMIHANAIRTILNKEFITEIPYLYYFCVVLFFVAITYLITIAKGSLIGFIFSGFFMGFILILGNILYKNGIYLEKTALFFSVTASLMFGFFMNFLNIKEERTRVKGIFKQYVSPNIVDRFVSGEESLSERGKERNVSVLFADIVGFTSLCEKFPAEQVVEKLNDVLDVLTEEVFKFEGTLDKFMGDALMAVWGSPVEQENHAELSVSCALSMLEAVKSLNARWGAEGKSALDIGISIGSGKAIAGNIGAQKHKDYTVIGDVVNIAARLQPLTREGYSIVIEEKTKELIEGKHPVNKIGDVVVKGKKQKVIAWSVAPKN